MRQAHTHFTFTTTGYAAHKITAIIQNWLESINAQTGLITVLIQHTSASLLIQENADPDVQLDLKDWLDDLAPKSRNWRHSDEGPDDMPAHAKAALTNTSLSIPVHQGRLDLGTWQGVFLLEHRQHGSKRSLSICFQGE